MSYKESVDRKQYKPGSQKDICQTPGYALEPLLEQIISLNASKIWEPACGDGILVDAFEMIGCEVIATDIEKGYDFFEWNPPSPEQYDVIITNPPYYFWDKLAFVKRCIELGKPWALLMNTEMVSSKNFHKAVKDLDPQLGIVWFSPRVNFKMPNKKWEGTAYFPTAWFTWNMGFEGNKFKIMDHWDKEYRKRFEI